MVYHFEFDIAALILTVFMAVLIFFKKGLVRHANRVFLSLIGLLGILFSIENKDDTISPITGIFNRFALEIALDTAMDSEGYTLFLVKIPNLNYYN